MKLVSHFQGSLFSHFSVHNGKEHVWNTKSVSCFKENGGESANCFTPQQAKEVIAILEKVGVPILPNASFYITNVVWAISHKGDKPTVNMPYSVYNTVTKEGGFNAAKYKFDAEIDSRNIKEDVWGYASKVIFQLKQSTCSFIVSEKPIEGLKRYKTSNGGGVFVWIG